ncbi:hypothetical protein [Halegenticoccus tardaugens]|uniref:hypothetical protein n=1 Tax=Halegenticoccus tardaugens TaxID=2071624 RepID=UPI00100B7C02|nr:hypothetical protein [Halegenticoccus tardaugens]
MNPRIGRRSLLRLATTAGVVTLSGCNALGGSDRKTPRLVELGATSFDDEPHTFHVRIELDGETVYRDSERLEAASSDDPVGTWFTGFPTKSNAYLLSTWLDDRPEKTAQTLDFAEYDTECLGVDVRVGTYDGGTDDDRVSIFYTKNCEDGE